MDAPTFPFTEDELNKAGLLGEGVSEFTTQIIDTMKKHPDLLKLSLFALECINLQVEKNKGLSSLGLSGSSSRSDQSLPSSLSALTFTSGATILSEHGPDDYERTSYYNGITGDADHPELVYRSDFHITPFPKPSGRHAHIPIKSLRGVFDTPLNNIWDIVGPQICDLLKIQKVHWLSIDPARFFTHGSPEEQAKGTLGPVVIWISVKPGSMSPDTAHYVSQQILELLLMNKVEDVVVEWREAVPQRLAGHPLMCHVGSHNSTHCVRHFLTALLGVPLATEELEEEDSQGTLTLWFHENKDKNGNPSNKVYGVSSCHVLCKNTTIKYEYMGGAPKHHVQVCGMHRFQHGLDDITKAITDHGLLAAYWAEEIVKLGEKQEQNPETMEEIQELQHKLNDENKAIADLEAFYGDVTSHWSNIKLDRNIGYVQYASAIKVDEGGTKYTSDWAAFLVAEAKVKAGFEGNVVDLGSKYSPQELTDMFYPVGGGPTTFKFPRGRKLQIEGCATKQDLATSVVFDREDQHCLMVGKDGNTTGLTVGCYAGLVSFTQLNGVESIELGIYNAGTKYAEVFSDKGDSGSLVWHMRNGKAYIVGQLHSGCNKGGSTSNHVTYCTPGWYLLEQIKKEFKYADFYQTSW